MRQIIPFASSSMEAAENIAAFIAHWKSQISELPCTSAFDNDYWDLRGSAPIKSNSRGNGRLGLHFTKFNGENPRKERVPLNQPMRDLAKAWVLKELTEKSPKSFNKPRLLLEVWRYIEASMLANGLMASTEFLTPEILDAANLAIRTSLVYPAGQYSMCCELNQIARGLRECGLIQTIFDWHGVVVRTVSDLSRVGVEHDRIRKAKLPTDREMQAVGHVFHHAELPRHRYPIAMAAILSGQPGRIGEVLTLPVDCVFDDERDGRKIFRLRWRPEKGGVPMTKNFSYDTCPWIPHFKRAVAWLNEISEPARKIARWYEKNPTHVHLPEHLEGLRSKEWLDLNEVAAILQLKPVCPSEFEPLLRSRGIPLFGKGKERRTVRFSDVEDSVLAKLPVGFPLLDRASGLKHSEALCLVREHEFFGFRKHDNNPSHTMFQTPYHSFVMQLLNRAFDDHGLFNEDGDPIRIRTHEFRHRWCTRAEEAGIWRSFANAMSGRLTISQASSYDHMTADHVLQVKSETLQDDGHLFGELLAFAPKEPMYLHEVERQIQELAMLKAIVVTEYGICTNDFVQSPCEFHLDCLNCRNHACIKGLPIRTENIRKRLALQEKSLEMARVSLENGDYGVANHIKNTLEPNVQRLRAIVAILDDPRFKFGTEILLANGPSNHPITKALQIRINTLKNKGLDPITEVSMLLPPGRSPHLSLDSDL